MYLYTVHCSPLARPLAHLLCPPLRQSGTRTCLVQNEINSVNVALRSGTRSASGHSGSLERHDSHDGTAVSAALSNVTSASHNQLSHSAGGGAAQRGSCGGNACAGAGASSRGASPSNSLCGALQASPDAGAGTTEAVNLAINLDVGSEANTAFPRQSILTKSLVALGQGSSAVVFEGEIKVASDTQIVVIKERRPRATLAEDPHVRCHCES